MPEDNYKRSSNSIRSNRIDLLEVRGDDLLIYSLIVLEFSLSNKL